MTAPRWLLVARVSTADKKQDPESQVQALRLRAEREGAEVVGVVTDHRSAWSEKGAAEWERRVFAELATSGADTLAVWAMDRLTRRGPLHALQLVATLERHHRVGLFSLQEPFLSTATADPNLRGLLVPLFAWLAEQESARKGDRLTAKAQAKRNRAEAVGQRAKWGKGSMATNADRRRVHDLAEEGFSMRMIAGETGLSKSTVERILKQPVPPEPEGHAAGSPDAGAPSAGGGLGHALSAPLQNSTANGAVPGTAAGAGRPVADEKEGAHGA